MTMWMKIGVLSGIIVLAGVGYHVITSKNEFTVSVEVDVLSGQPNPVWYLPADDAAEIARLIEQLPADGEETDSTNVGLLGFRGFIVRRLILPRLGDHEHITVFTDQVVITKVGQDLQTVPDPEGSVHMALRAKAKTHVSNEIYKSIPN